MQNVYVILNFDSNQKAQGITNRLFFWKNIGIRAGHHVIKEPAVVSAGSTFNWLMF